MFETEWGLPMDKILLFFVYLITTMFAVLISLNLLGIREVGYKGVVIGLINGLNDYVVREVLVGKAHFFSGFHFITGFLIISLLVYWLYGTNKKIALVTPIISYAITSVSEIMMILLLIPLAGKEFLEQAQHIPYLQACLGLITQLPVIILFIFIMIKARKHRLIEKLNINTKYNL